MSLELVKFKNDLYGVKRRVMSPMGYEFWDFETGGFWWAPDSEYFHLCKSSREIAESEIKRLKANPKPEDEIDDFEGLDFGEVVG